VNHITILGWKWRKAECAQVAAPYAL